VIRAVMYLKQFLRGQEQPAISHKIREKCICDTNNIDDTHAQSIIDVIINWHI